MNTVSSLAFCVAGLVVAARARRRTPGTLEAPDPSVSAETALGWAAVATGLGSVAYHGPGTRAGHVLHDASLITMLGTLVAADATRATGRPAPRALYAALPVASTVAAASSWSTAVQLAAAVAAIGGEVARVRRDQRSGRRGLRPAVEALVALGGASGHVLGRTGGPLCRPDSPLQAHAAWHTAMAALLVIRD
ncbi:MAG: hypothetical protein JST73_04540 [Actinobacteria bacterium]|nr:hypothetical protein [Actinomycetota bacterium]